MKLITKNRTKALQGHLESFSEVTYYTHENDYKGVTVNQSLDARTVRSVLEDIKEGQASLWYNSLDDSYVLKYADPCKWVLRK